MKIFVHRNMVFQISMHNESKDIFITITKDASIISLTVRQYRNLLWKMFFSFFLVLGIVKVDEEVV